MPHRESRSAMTMATGSLIPAWWDRLRGRLQPEPFPFEKAGMLDMPLRRLVGSPERVLGEFGVGASERVLEIGPGIGYYSVEAARRIGAGGFLVCLDIQRAMLGAVRRRLADAGLPGAHMLQASGVELPLRSGSLDRIVLIAVLGELPDRPRAMREFRRVLRPGGRLSISEQLPDPDFVTKGTLRRELSGAGFREEATRGHLVYTSTWSAAA
jgi:ubiquinone/menaquinone biosynthesis C-methylase UbiE